MLFCFTGMPNLSAAIWTGREACRRGTMHARLRLLGLPGGCVFLRPSLVLLFLQGAFRSVAEVPLHLERPR